MANTDNKVHKGQSERAKVVVLGARGQLGSLVAQQAPARTELICAGSEVDISNKLALAAFFQQTVPDLVINAAAYTQVDKAETEKEQAWAVNAAGPGNIAELLPASCPVIHISTDFVFDGVATHPYTPDSPARPLGVYGASKLAGEQALLSKALTPPVIIRTSWLYSAQGKNFMNTMLALMDSRDSLSVVSDQIGTPTSAHGLAEVIWAFVEKMLNQKPRPAGIFHWSDTGAISWYEFALGIQQEGLAAGLLTKAVPVQAIPTSGYPTPAKRPAYSVLDTSQTTAVTGIMPRPWREELKDVISRKVAS